VNEVGLPFHVPSEVVTVWPTAAVPVIAGSTVLLGTAFVLAEPAEERSAAAMIVPNTAARTA
jgi:hydrogenase maturation factor HypE